MHHERADGRLYNSGSAYLSEKPESGWPATLTESTKLTASNGAFLDYFGQSVSISGEAAVIGFWEKASYVFLRFEPVAWLCLPVVLRAAP